MASSARFVFVSHCSADQEEAGRVVAHYEAQGIRMWWGPRDVQPAQDINQQVGWAVQNCSAMLVVASEACRGSISVRAETEQAARAGKPIFLVRMADVYLSSDLPALAQARVVTDAFGPNAQANVARLTQELQAVVSGPAPAFGASPAPARGQNWAPPAPATGPGWVPPAGAQAGSTGSGTGFPPPRGGPINPEQEQLLRAYVRNNADYYLGKWRQMDARNKRTSFNWAAFFLNALWLIYRKMWGLGLAILLGVLAANAVVLAISPFLSPVVSLLSIGMAIFVGLMGNSLYRRQADREVARAAASSPEMHGRMSQLSRRGGTNIGGAIAVAVAAAILNSVILFSILAMQGAFNPSKAVEGRSKSENGTNATNSSREAETNAAETPTPTRERLLGQWGVTCGAKDMSLVFNDDGTLRLGAEGGQWEVTGQRITINHDNGEEEVLTVRSLSDDELRFTSNADPTVSTVRRC